MAAEEGEQVEGRQSSMQRVQRDIQAKCRQKTSDTHTGVATVKGREMNILQVEVSRLVNQMGVYQ